MQIVFSCSILSKLSCNIQSKFTLCPWEIFYAFLSSADFFQNHFFSKNSFMNTIGVSNSLDLDQAWHFVRPGLGPNCLQRLSADDTSRQRVITLQKWMPVSSVDYLSKHFGPRTLGLIWIQTVWHSDRVPERIVFWIISYCLSLASCDLSSADNFCKQFRPRSGQTKCRSWSGSKLFDTLIVFLKELFEKVVILKKKSQHTTTKAWKITHMQRVNYYGFIMLM